MAAYYHYFSNLYDLLNCITRAIDLISPNIANHHQRVAYLSFHIAEALRLPVHQKQTLVTAALLHDTGAIAFHDRLDIIEEGSEGINKHAYLGAELFSDFPVLQEASRVIRYHHVSWSDGAGSREQTEAVPYLSHILHLADRIVVKIRRYEFIISQMAGLKEYAISERGRLFAPEIVDAYLSLCDREALWLDMTYQLAVSTVSEALTLNAIKLTLDDAVALAKIFARIIDFRSPFTAMHSSGVAAVAVKLAELSGMSEDECKMMHIAGYLHDIGKLVVPRKILEKQGMLLPSEYDIIRAHSYYTYRLLKPISGFEVITEWASFHHEKLNGRGYPFRIKGPSLSLGARIMAVADIFAALTEDRPYRRPMDKKQVITILSEMAAQGDIAPSICNLLFDNYELISNLRIAASETEIAKYTRTIQL